MWKYITWIKAHVGGDDADLCKTRLTEEQRQKVRSRPIYYEEPKDNGRKLSFTFSLDVVKFILAFLSDVQTESNKINQCGEGAEVASLVAVNLACETKLTLVELL